MMVEFWAYGVLAAVLIAASVTDVRRGRIPNALTYSAMAAGFIGHALLGGLYGGPHRMGAMDALAGFAAGFLPMLAAWLAGGVGGGDAKLMGAVGALTGWKFALAALFYGLVFAAIMAVIIMIRRRIVLQTLGRLWRFVVLAFSGVRPPDPTTSQSPRVPLGLAMAMGAAAVFIEWTWFHSMGFSILGF